MYDQTYLSLVDDWLIEPLSRSVYSDREDTITEAVTVKRERILSVGTNEDVKKLISDGTKVIDLKEKTLLPGFIDTHCHPALGGTEIFEVNCRSPPVRSIEKILEKIREKVEKTPTNR